MSRGLRKSLRQSSGLSIPPGPFCHGYEADNGRGRFHGNLRMWENDKAFREFCFDSGLPQIAAQFFGSSRVNLLYDQLFVKEPGTPNRTRWHNDQPYWPVRGWHVMSFWLALDPTTAENGRLEFVRARTAGTVGFSRKPSANDLTTTDITATRSIPITRQCRTSNPIAMLTKLSPGICNPVM